MKKTGIYKISSLINNRVYIGSSVDFSEKIKKIHLGIPKTEEHKLKISQSNKGRIINKKTRDAVSEANRNRIITEETRLKISEGLKNRFCSEETRLKRSISMKNYFINKQKNKNGNNTAD